MNPIDDFMEEVAYSHSEALRDGSTEADAMIYFQLLALRIEAEVMNTAKGQLRFFGLYDTLDEAYSMLAWAALRMNNGDAIEALYKEYADIMTGVERAVTPLEDVPFSEITRFALYGRNNDEPITPILEWLRTARAWCVWLCKDAEVWWGGTR